MNMEQVSQIRAFNRYYTSIIGLLDQDYLNSDLSLTEVRILYELHHHPAGMTASDIITLLNLDKGYLSRILQKFEKSGFIDKKQSGIDKRSSNLFLSMVGRKLFEKLNNASSDQIQQMLSNTNENERSVLVNCMSEIRQILSNTKRNITLDDITIRTELQPGDIGYVTFMHGDLYKKENDYGIGFETYVAQGFYEFYKTYDAAKDRVWIAEHNGKMIGFLLLMHRRDDTAQLRFFIIDPAYRGIGLGKKMANLYMQFLKGAGYKHCYLWTTNEQLAAIDIYKKMGFTLTEEKPSTAFGKPLNEQRYDLTLKLTK